MPTTLTSRLKLKKPDPVSGFVLVSELNDSMDILDANPGAFVCTSTTRPATPFEGQQIYETDTKKYYTRIGSNWVWMASAETWTQAEAWKAELVNGTNGRFARARFIANDLVFIYAFIRRDDGANYAQGDHAGLFRMPTAFRPSVTRYMPAVSWVNGAVAPYQDESTARIGSDGNCTFAVNVTTTGMYLSAIYEL